MPTGYSNKTGLPFFKKGNKLGSNLKTGKIVKCKLCGREVYKRKSDIRSKNIFCSRICFGRFNAPNISKKLKGKILSEETKDKLRQYCGKKASAWKGGKPKCKVCNKEISYGRTYCLNHKHLLWTKEHFEKARQGVIKSLTGKMPKNIMRPGKFMNIKRGYFDINGKKMFFRSKWEANYALYLDWLKKEKQISDWQYEKDVFIFEKIKLGTRSYRPDFKIFNTNGTFEYHEIKGWMDKKSQTKMKRMRIYYPKIKLLLVDRHSYGDIYKKVGKICGFI